MRKALITIAGLSLILAGCSDTSYFERGFSPGNSEYQVKYMERGVNVVEMRRLVAGEKGVMTSKIIGVERTLIKDGE